MARTTYVCNQCERVVVWYEKSSFEVGFYYVRTSGITRTYCEECLKLIAKQFVDGASL
jgi:hypothetical protein